MRVSATKNWNSTNKKLSDLEFSTYWDLTNRIEDFTTTGDVSDAGRGVSEAKVVDLGERWVCLTIGVSLNSTLWYFNIAIENGHL